MFPLDMLDMNSMVYVMINCEKSCDDDGSTIKDDSIILSGGVCKTYELRMMTEGIGSIQWTCDK